MKKILFTLGLGLGLWPAAFAQRTFSSATGDSLKKQETQIIVTESNASTYFSTPASDFKTQLKFNPTHLGNGDMVFLLEQALKGKMSMELGAGLTYRDYINDSFDFMKYDYDHQFVDYERSMGYSLSGAIKYYVSKDYPVLEGYYVGPEIRYRLYKTVATKCGDEKINVPQREHVTDLKLTCGYTEYFDDNIFMEIYAGFGVRSRNFMNFVEGEEVDYTDSRGFTKYKTVVTISDANKVVPVVNAGFKIGFAF